MASNFQEMFLIDKKSKEHSHDLFFSWTSDLLLVNFSRYSLFGVYFSIHQGNIKSKRIIEIKRKIYISTCLCYWCWKILMESENFLSAIEHIFLKVIKQPFHRGVNPNRILIKKCPYYYVLIFFSSPYIL